MTHPSDVLTVLLGCYTAGATWNCCHLGAHSVNTIQPCTGCYTAGATWNSRHLGAHSVNTIQPCTGCYMAGATWNCCHLGASFVNIIQPSTSLQSLHSKPHMWGACVFSCNLPPALLAEWPGSSMGVEWIPNRKLTLEENVFLPLLRGFEPTTSEPWIRRSNH